MKFAYPRPSWQPLWDCMSQFWDGSRRKMTLPISSKVPLESIRISPSRWPSSRFILMSWSWSMSYIRIPRRGIVVFYTRCWFLSFSSMAWSCWLLLLGNYRDRLMHYPTFASTWVNLGGTKVLVLNASKKSLTNLHFYYQAIQIEFTTAYTYLGVQFTGPRFGMQ